MVATMKDLRLHSKVLLDAVERSEEIIITYRGKPKATLVRIETESRENDSEDQELFGLWRDRDDETPAPLAFIRKLRN